MARSTSGGVEYEAGREGRLDERGHVPTPPHVWLRGRLQPTFSRCFPRVIWARPADHGGPWPGVRPPPLEQNGGVLLRGGPRRACGGAPPAPFARPISRPLHGPPKRSWRLIINCGKRAACRCYEKPPGRSQYGWGSSCDGHFRVPFTMRREATKRLPGRGGGEGQSPSVAVSHRCTRAAELRGSRRRCSRR